MNANTEKNEQVVVVETVVENLLETALLAIDEESVHTAEIEDEGLKAALSAALQARGLVSCPPPLLAMTAMEGWKETLRQRLCALCKAHKPGSTYNIKISDLQIDEVKSVKNGNKKSFIPVDPHTAISKWASTIMSDSVDKTNRATKTVIPASNPVSFTLRGPSSRRPTLEISFDF